jgi:Amt family ammonium transporter
MTRGFGVRAAVMTGALAALATTAWGGAAAAATVPAKPLLAHQVALQLDSGGTAWMIAATAMVLLMTLPGLALFYGGMVRRKNLLATIAQQVAISAIVTVLWFVLGYSLSFGVAPGALNPWIGSLDAMFLNGVRPDTAYSGAKGLPEYLYFTYQLTFAIITPALITGAVAERMKFSGLILFMSLWHILVYCPIAHWVWGGGFLGTAGVLDFAGGSVVHVNSGVAGLVCCLFMGPRKGFRRDNMAPNNLVYTAIGAALLLFGWIGFNAGSATAADAIASVAMLNTLLAAMVAAISWTVVEWIERKKPTLLGMLSGIVAGLVAITPAAGFVDPKGAFVIGLLAGPVCYAGAVWLKNALKYDDSLDAFGVHGIGGMLGALLTGVFATTAINAASNGHDIVKQALGLGATIVWSAGITFLILLLCKFTTGLRVSEEIEVEGLDYALHGEALHE